VIARAAHALSDLNNQSCRSAYSRPVGRQGGRPPPHHTITTASAVDRDGAWRHVAVTWDAAADGLTKIYLNGMLSE
jgi:hypothetical protein